MDAIRRVTIERAEAGLAGIHQAEPPPRRAARVTASGFAPAPLQ